MARQLSKVELMRLPFMKGLHYEELLVAQGLVENDADLALLYFWYNLKTAMYWPCFTEEMVQKEVVYYTNMYPAFEGAIIDWFNDYLETVKDRKNEITRAKV